MGRRWLEFKDTVGTEGRFRAMTGRAGREGYDFLGRPLRRRFVDLHRGNVVTLVASQNDPDVYVLDASGPDFVGLPPRTVTTTDLPEAAAVVVRGHRRRHGGLVRRHLRRTTDLYRR